MHTDNDTRSSLVRGLKNWDDQQHWSDFASTYSKLIFSVARQAGLSEQEAEDVVQETTLTVAKKMEEFEYDPKSCSFKGWVMRCTQLRILDQLRKRQPSGQESLRNGDDTKRTSTMDGIPDPQSLQVETIWEDEWKKNIVEVALNRLKDRLKPEHFQLFYLSVVKHFGVREVAAMLGMTSARVYLIRHRIAKVVRKEIELIGEKG